MSLEMQNSAYFSFLNLILLNNDLIKIVKLMQINKKGVPGNHQNKRQVDPTPKHHLLKSVPQVIKPKRYGTQTSHETMAQTIPNIKNVRQSLILSLSHTNGFLK